MKDKETTDTPSTTEEIRSNSPDMFRLYKMTIEDAEQLSDSSESLDSPRSVGSPGDFTASSKESSPVSSPRIGGEIETDSDSTDSEGSTISKEQLAGNIFRNHLRKLAALEILERLDFKATVRSLGVAQADLTSSESKFSTADGELELVKQLGGGNNAKVYAAKFNGDADNWVVKAFNFKTKHRSHIAQKDLMKIIIERNLLRKDQQDARIFYDQTNRQVYLLMPKAKGVEASVVFKRLLSQILDPQATEQQRSAALANAFRLLNQILTRLEEFTKRTGHLHCDAHFGNAYVDVTTDENPDVPNYNVTLIDYGGCCPVNTSLKEYISLFSPLGQGDDFTAPEVPTRFNTNSKAAEYGKTITERADLHTVMGNFVRDFILDLLDDEANKSKPIIAGTKVDDLVQEFLQWSLTYCCNSDGFINSLGSDCSAAVAAKKQRNSALADLGYDVKGRYVNSLGVRNNFSQARAMLSLFIEELDEEREKEGAKPKKGM